MSQPAEEPFDKDAARLAEETPVGHSRMKQEVHAALESTSSPSLLTRFTVERLPERPALEAACHRVRLPRIRGFYKPESARHKSAHWHPHLRTWRMNFCFHGAVMWCMYLTDSQIFQRKHRHKPQEHVPLLRHIVARPSRPATGAVRRSCQAPVTAAEGMRTSESS